MKLSLIVTVLALLALAGCEKKSDETVTSAPAISPSGTLPAGHPPVSSNNDAMSPSDGTDIELTEKATVVSTINVPQFTYLEISQDQKLRWLATSTVDAKKGNTIMFDSGSTMTNFNSNTLRRTFPSITFVNRVEVVRGK